VSGGSFLSVLFRPANLKLQKGWYSNCLFLPTEQYVSGL
jgi:hypothetical protein